MTLHSHRSGGHGVFWLAQWCWASSVSSANQSSIQVKPQKQGLFRACGPFSRLSSIACSHVHVQSPLFALSKCIMIEFGDKPAATRISFQFGALLPAASNIDPKPTHLLAGHSLGQSPSVGMSRGRPRRETSPTSPSTPLRAWCEATSDPCRFDTDPAGFGSILNEHQHPLFRFHR